MKRTWIGLGILLMGLGGVVGKTAADCADQPYEQLTLELLEVEVDGEASESLGSEVEGSLFGRLDGIALVVRDAEAMRRVHEENFNVAP